MRRVLEEEQLLLRPLVARDAGELFLLTDQHREYLRRNMTWVDRTQAISDVSYYILSLNGFWKAGITYGIFEGEVLTGTVGFHHSDHRNDRTEIGYWLAPPFQGRGLATKAVRMALDAAFRFTSVNRVEAKINPENRASVRVVEKLNFTLEGVEREGIKFQKVYRDHRLYSLLKREWHS